MAKRGGKLLKRTGVIKKLPRPHKIISPSSHSHSRNQMKRY